MTVKPGDAINWIHDGTTAHSIRRVDFHVTTAHCGFTFLPTRNFQPLTRTSASCPSCHSARPEVAKR